MVVLFFVLVLYVSIYFVCVYVFKCTCTHTHMFTLIPQCICGGQLVRAGSPLPPSEAQLWPLTWQQTPIFSFLRNCNRTGGYTNLHYDLSTWVS